MRKTKLCLGSNDSFGMSIREQILLYKNVGFDSFFTGWNSDMNVREIKRFADEHGMIYQSIHAPIGRMADMWKTGPEAEIAVTELMECLDDCIENRIPIMVCHCFIGFGEHEVNEVGVQHFARIVQKANEAGVKIAFENCECEQFLEALMEAFRDYPCVGFCWDTGHEMCYNHSRDMMALYGERLICTHLNDNLGISAEDGSITWLDDLHLLPFDGIADWEGIVRRLNKYRYHGELTFELNNESKPGRHENDVYKEQGIEVFVAEAYKRACKIIELKRKESGEV